MSMNTEGEYRTDRRDKIHRIAALAVTVVATGLVFIHAGAGEAIRMMARCLLFTSFIWFADAFGSAGMAGNFEKGKRGPAIIPGVFRFVGWFALLAWTALAVIAWMDGNLPSR